MLESLEAGKRLPEARFATLKLAASGQGSVYGGFGGKAATSAGHGRDGGRSTAATSNAGTAAAGSTDATGSSSVTASAVAAAAAAAAAAEKTTR